MISQFARDERSMQRQQLGDPLAFSQGAPPTEADSKSLEMLEGKMNRRGTVSSPTSLEGLEAVQRCESTMPSIAELKARFCALSGTGMSWNPAWQVLFHQGEVYAHEGPTNTDPTHDMAHLIIALGSRLAWMPEGDQLRVAEYNAVFVEHLLDNSYWCVTNQSIEANSILKCTLDYARWFVEQHYAPFPIPTEEAYRQFCGGIDPDAVVGLAPLFFELKRRERQCDYMNRRWDVQMSIANQPIQDLNILTFQLLVKRLLETITGHPQSVKETPGNLTTHAPPIPLFSGQFT
jgi:hypothetical protein